ESQTRLSATSATRAACPRELDKLTVGGDAPTERRLRRTDYMNPDVIFMIFQPLARLVKKVTMFVIQLCTSVPALAGLEMIQTTMRIIITQVRIFDINRFHLLRLANISASRCPRLPK
ncbi:MAG: hypothetical protein ACRDOE_04365, partial [Streptosporangiaceae bacterium]